MSRGCGRGMIFGAPQERPVIFSSAFRQGHSMMHKFTIGQAVDLLPRVLRPAATGEYEIRRLVPAHDGEPGDPCYRIKSISEKHERVAYESELTPSRPSHPVFS